MFKKSPYFIENQYGKIQITKGNYLSLVKKKKIIKKDSLLSIKNQLKTKRKNIKKNNLITNLW